MAVYKNCALMQTQFHVAPFVAVWCLETNGLVIAQDRLDFHQQEQRKVSRPTGLCSVIAVHEPWKTPGSRT